MQGAAPVAAVPTTLPADLPDDFRAAINAFESDVLSRALKDARHNQRAAAKRLGLGYHKLRNLLRKHGLMLARDKE